MLKKKLFNLKYKLATSASLYPNFYNLLASRLYKSGKSFTSKSTDIVIDGFPRCANTFATNAFVIAQTREMNIAHHVHKPSQFITAKAYNIPAILLIRKPEDCISSLLIRQPLYEPKTLLEGYRKIYEPLIHLDNYVLADFQTVLTDFGSTINQVNQKFKTSFKLYSHSKTNEEEVRKKISQQKDLEYGNAQLKMAAPTKEKEKLKVQVLNELRSKENRKFLAQCDELYNEFRRRE